MFDLPKKLSSASYDVNAAKEFLIDGEYQESYGFILNAIATLESCKTNMEKSGLVIPRQEETTDG